MARAAAITQRVAEKLRDDDRSTARWIGQRYINSSVVYVTPAAKPFSEVTGLEEPGPTSSQVRLWNPSDENVGVIRSIADTVASCRSLGRCPQQQFQLSTVESATQAVISALENPEGEPVVDVAQRKVHTLAAVAEELHSNMNGGAVIFDSPSLQPEEPQVVPGTGVPANLQPLMRAAAQEAERMWGADTSKMAATYLH